MRELHASGKFDPSVYPPPCLSPLPAPVEVQAALNIGSQLIPDLDVGELPEEPAENTKIIRANTSKTPRPKLLPAQKVSASRVERPRLANPISSFVPARIATRPLLLSFAAKKPTKAVNETAATTLRKRPIIIKNVKIKLRLTRDKHGKVCLHRD